MIDQVINFIQHSWPLPFFGL